MLRSGAESPEQGLTRTHAKNEKAKSELQAQAPRNGFQLNRATVGGEEIGPTENCGNAEYAG